MTAWEQYLKANNSVISESQISQKLFALISKLVTIANEKSSLVFTAGNGGSATTADHFAADLALTNKRVGHQIPAICLNSHLGLNSALSNDLNYEDSLSEHLKNFKSGGHTLVVFSASGNSQNLINLLNTASSMGMESWALLGFDGGKIAKMPQTHSLVFFDKFKNYGIAENSHLLASHFIIEQVNLNLGKT